MTPARLLEQRLPSLSALVAMPATRQLIRYVLAGFCVTQIAALIYSALVFFLGVDPLLANVMSTASGLGVGYLVHSRWTFATGSGDSETLQVGRFIAASLVAFVINSIWVLLCVKALRLSPLAPVPLMMLATPWVSFLLNRYWVFKAA